MNTELTVLDLIIKPHKSAVHRFVYSNFLDSETLRITWEEEADLERARRVLFSSRGNKLSKAVSLAEAAEFNKFGKCLEQLFVLGLLELHETHILYLNEPRSNLERLADC